MTCLQHTQLSISAQERLNEASIRDQMELNKLVAREQILNNSKFELTERKMQLQEYRRAVKNASYTKVSVSEEGEIKTEVKNDLLALPKRPIANFLFDDIVELVSSDGERGIYALGLTIDGRQEQIFLRDERMGKTEYFLKKITSVGGRLFVDREKDRRNILIGIWSELRRRCSKKMIIPVARGWLKEENEYKFIKEGALLWDEISRRAR